MTIELKVTSFQLDRLRKLLTRPAGSGYLALIGLPGLGGPVDRTDSVTISIDDYDLATAAQHKRQSEQTALPRTSAFFDWSEREDSMVIHVFMHDYHVECTAWVLDPRDPHVRAEKVLDGRNGWSLRDYAEEFYKTGM